MAAGGALDLLLEGPQARRLLWGCAPDPAALALVWLALRAEAWAASAGAFALGFLRDGVSAGPAGGWALTLVLLALLVKALTYAVEINRSWSVFLLLFAAVLFVGLVLYPFLMYIFTGISPLKLLYQYFSIYCIQGLTTALLGLPAFRLLDRAAAERSA